MEGGTKTTGEETEDDKAADVDMVIENEKVGFFQFRITLAVEMIFDKEILNMNMNIRSGGEGGDLSCTRVERLKIRIRIMENRKGRRMRRRKRRIILYFELIFFFESFLEFFIPPEQRFTLKKKHWYMSELGL